MALFGALNIALSGLHAQMAALQTIGHNISNAATPGFSRQRVELETLPPNDLVIAQFGTGVQLKGIRRMVDEALQSRIQDASSSLGSLRVKSNTMDSLEQTFQALQGTDIGVMLDRFFQALDDLASNPTNTSVRATVVEEAGLLSETFNQLEGQIRDLRNQLNDEVGVAVNEINRITEEIAQLNRSVVESENAGVDRGTANDLRDRRDLLVRQLSEYVGIKAIETSTGEVNVLLGSSFLVFSNQSFALTTENSVDQGSLIATPVFADGNGAVTLGSGSLEGLVESRDGILSDFLQDLNVLANSLIFEMNKVHSTGQGLQRLSDVTSVDGVSDADYPLAIAGSATAASTKSTIIDSSLIGIPDPVGQDVLVLSGENIMERRRITGFDSTTGTMTLDSDFKTALSIGDRFQITSLNFPIQNGSFDFVVTNELTGIQETFKITVDLDKLPGGAMDDSPLSDTNPATPDIVSQINAINPGVIVASVTSDGKLRIQSTTGDIRFSFANDTSHFLAAIGMNTFFTGHDTATMGVNPLVANNPNFLTAARSSSQGDNSNALAMVALRDAAVVEDQSTFEEFYQGLISRVAVDTAKFKSRFEDQQLVSQQLENQRERISGVNIDEEAVNMISHQRAFQATARYIAVVDQLLNTLINGI